MDEVWTGQTLTDFHSVHKPVLGSDLVAFGRLDEPKYRANSAVKWPLHHVARSDPERKQGKVG
jgi:hypothetical protein